MKERSQAGQNHFGDRGQRRENFYRDNSSSYKQRLEDVPHEEIVRGIRDTIAEAKLNWEKRNKKGTFDPVEWVGFILTPHLQNKPSPLERDLAVVWDVVSEPLLKSQRFRSRVRAGIEVESRINGRHRTLVPKAVKLLDALTDALNIPHERGQKTFDILKNFPEQDVQKSHPFYKYAWKGHYQEHEQKGRRYNAYQEEMQNAFADSSFIDQLWQRAKKEHAKQKEFQERKRWTEMCDMYDYNRIIQEFLFPDPNPEYAFLLPTTYEIGKPKPKFIEKLSIWDALASIFELLIAAFQKLNPRKSKYLILSTSGNHATIPLH